MEIYNSYSYVNITGNVSEFGGVVGNVSSGCKLENNIALGNLYSSKLSTTPKRIIGSGTLTDTNYAYSNQRLNGLLETTKEANIKLLTPEELLTQTTYTNMLNYGNAYDYSQLGENILPKLHKINEDGTYSNELLLNQEDIYLDISKEFKIDSVEIEKNAVDQIAGQIVVINSNEAEVTGLEIDGMDVTVTSVITRDGKSYINITAKPNKFYDTYKITKVKYKEEGQSKEQEVEGKIEVQFYKELYNFEDWQEIEEGTYQNYRLMSDIDFAGRKNVKTNVTMARLEAVGGTKSLKNIDLTFNEAGNGLIQDITTKLSDVRFENIRISYDVTSNSDKGGIIINSSADMSNLEFNNIEILGEKIHYIGVIGYSTSSYVENINLIDITVKGRGYVGSFMGEYYPNSAGKFYNSKADEINVIGSSNNIGGLIGFLMSEDYSKTLEDIIVENFYIEGKSNIGGITGNATRMKLRNILVEHGKIYGDSTIGGITGYNSTGMGNLICNDITIMASGSTIGGISGIGGQITDAEVTSCTINAGVNSNNVGGAVGDARWFNIYIKVTNTSIDAAGNNIGGIAGTFQGTNIDNSLFVGNIEGNNNVGGIVGNQKVGSIYLCYVSANITTNSNAGGMVGYLDNTEMTAVSNTSSLYVNYAADTTVEGKSNVGGIFGNIAEELYMPESNYYNNFAEVYLNADDNASISLGIGGKKSQNQYLSNTYYYKYSSINNENPNEQNEVFINTDQYLIENDLKQQTTFTSKLKWSTDSWDFSMLANNKYPILKSSSIGVQEGIDIPKDSEHIITNTENSIDTQSIETQEPLEQTFKFNNKIIQTYSTYSVITAEDGTQVTRNAKLYSKDNTLYAIPTVLSTTDEGKITPVANNLIVDSYNGKEYETVLGSDGRIYDLKEPITYPKNFVNSDIASIGNNLNSAVKEVEVIYKNGDKIKFNYQTGEVIYSEKGNSTNSTERSGLFNYIKEKISELGENSDDELSTEITTKYKDSKELQNKLEDTSIEEAIENQNYNSQTLENSVNNTEETTTETNNSLKENKYISIYNEETGEYEIYNEEELLDTNKEEVVSENEKIEANNLSEYYASEGETRSTKMGIVWIVISIIGVGIILIILKKNLKKKA